MSGEGRLNGDIGGLAVSDFSHHHNIRILAEKRPQAIGKGDAGFYIDLRLINARNIVLNRIFNGANIDIRIIQ